MLFSLQEMLLLCLIFYISGSFIHILVLVQHIKFMLFKEAESVLVSGTFSPVDT